MKGGKDLLLSWVSDENLTILDDLLPGFFGTYYQMSFMPMSVSCETAEYLPGKIHMLIYGNMASSTSNALELARYLQLEHNVENPDIAKYYLFDLGEPAFAGGCGTTDTCITCDWGGECWPSIGAENDKSGVC